MIPPPRTALAVLFTAGAIACVVSGACGSATPVSTTPASTTPASTTPASTTPASTPPLATSPPATIQAATTQPATTQPATPLVLASPTSPAPDASPSASASPRISTTPTAGFDPAYVAHVSLPPPAGGIALAALLYARVGGAPQRMRYALLGERCNGPELAAVPADHCLRREDNYECGGVVVPDDAAASLGYTSPPIWFVGERGPCRAVVGPLTLIPTGDHCAVGSSSSGYAVVYPISQCENEVTEARGAPFVIFAQSLPRSLSYGAPVVRALARMDAAVRADREIARVLGSWWRAMRPTPPLPACAYHSRAEHSVAGGPDSERLELLRATLYIEQPTDTECRPPGDRLVGEDSWVARAILRDRSGAALDVPLGRAQESVHARPPGVLLMDGRIVLAAAATRISVSIFERRDSAFPELLTIQHSYVHEDGPVDLFFFGNHEFYSGP